MPCNIRDLLCLTATSITTRAERDAKVQVPGVRIRHDPAIGDLVGRIEAGTPFESLPEDWVCPICGAGKDVFYPVD
jgi:rubredoxin